MIFGFFFLLSSVKVFFSAPFRFLFWLSVLLSFLLLSNWFLFLSSFVFPLLFWYCFIHISLAHVVSSLVYPNLLGTKSLGGCCCCCCKLYMALIYAWSGREANMWFSSKIKCYHSSLIYLVALTCWYIYHDTSQYFYSQYFLSAIMLVISLCMEHNFIHNDLWIEPVEGFLFSKFF
jgi:hypothetical protein